MLIKIRLSLTQQVYIKVINWIRHELYIVKLLKGTFAESTVVQ